MLFYKLTQNLLYKKIITGWPKKNRMETKKREKNRMWWSEDGCSGNHVDPNSISFDVTFIPSTLLSSPLLSPHFSPFSYISSKSLSEVPLPLCYSNRWAFFDFDPKYWFLFFPSQFRPLRFEYYRQSHLGFVQIQGIVESFSLPIQNWNESFIL